ncbi:hypothetical protein B0T18DRAFT_201108 [Schizothecium vesticola]|uniref:Uncharacterized protein n=1 Tax=Schizothecium vesticola TaxID=314040 RepID=A0AA40BTB0_9PEZI|nr:hypothetical protein B0T18DRAFT_201108 [Schizothecium vesticola]
MACERWCGDGGQRFPRKMKQPIACRKPGKENRTLKWTHIPRPFARLPTVPGPCPVPGLHCPEGRRPETEAIFRPAFPPSSTPPPGFVHTPPACPPELVGGRASQRIGSETGGRGHPQRPAFVQRPPTLPASPHPLHPGWPSTTDASLARPTYGWILGEYSWLLPSGIDQPAFGRKSCQQCPGQPQRRVAIDTLLSGSSSKGTLRRGSEGGENATAGCRRTDAVDQRHLPLQSDPCAAEYLVNMPGVTCELLCSGLGRQFLPISMERYLPFGGQRRPRHGRPRGPCQRQRRGR